MIKNGLTVWDHIEGQNGHLALSTSYKEGLTIGTSEKVHSKLTSLRQKLQQKALSEKNEILYSLAKRDDFFTRLTQRKEVDLLCIEQASKDGDFDGLEITPEELKEAYIKGYETYTSQVAKLFRNRSISPFEALAMFKAKNCLITAEKSSNNLIRQLQNFIEIDPESEVLNVKKYNKPKVAYYLAICLDKQTEAFRYSQATQYRLAKDTNSTDFGTQRVAQAARDDIENSLLQSRREARSVFTLLNLLNINQQNLATLVNQYSSPNKINMSNKRKQINFDKSKDTILGSIDPDNLEKISWKELDGFGGLLKVDQVDNRRPVAIAKQLRFGIEKPEID